MDLNTDPHLIDYDDLRIPDKKPESPTAPPSSKKNAVPAAATQELPTKKDKE